MMARLTLEQAKRLIKLRILALGLDLEKALAGVDLDELARVLVEWRQSQYR